MQVDILNNYTTMTDEEFEKLEMVLEYKFSLNEADAISRVITDETADCEKMSSLLDLIESNNTLDRDSYDDMLEEY